jgi:hypothetical protein
LNAGDGETQKTPQRGGVFDQAESDVLLSRAPIERPPTGTFFRRQCGARIRDHFGIMVVGIPTVNSRSARACTIMLLLQKKSDQKKKSRAQKSPA